MEVAKYACSTQDNNHDDDEDKETDNDENRKDNDDDDASMRAVRELALTIPNCGSKSHLPIKGPHSHCSVLGARKCVVSNQNDNKG